MLLERRDELEHEREYRGRCGMAIAVCMHTRTHNVVGGSTSGSIEAGAAWLLLSACTSAHTMWRVGTTFLPATCYLLPLLPTSRFPLPTSRLLLTTYYCTAYCLLLTYRMVTQLVTQVDKSRSLRKPHADNGGKLRVPILGKPGAR